MAAYQHDWSEGIPTQYDMVPRRRHADKNRRVYLADDVDALLARIREAARDVESAAYAAQDCDGTRLGDALDALNKVLGCAE